MFTGILCLGEMSLKRLPKTRSAKCPPAHLGLPYREETVTMQKR